MKICVLIATMATDGWEACLEPLRTQTVRPTDILVVVDRATDEAERTALRAEHPDVTFVFNAENLGQTQSLQVGLEACDADLVFRVDDDDFCLPERIEKQIAALERDGADLVCSFAHGEVVGQASRWLISCPVEDVAIKQALLHSNLLVHSTIGFRRDAVMRIGGYDATFRYAQDYDLYLRATRAGLRFACVPEPLVVRTYSGTSITVAKRKVQLLYAAAARLLHAAALGDVRGGLVSIGRVTAKLAIPDWARNVKRQMSLRTGVGR